MSSITFVSITVSQIVKNKTSPRPEGGRRALVRRAHHFRHFGELEVFKKLWNDGYWWKRIRNDIKKETGSCVPCLRYNVQKRGFHPMTPVIADLPWDHIAVDLVTSLLLSDSGHNTLLTIVCLITKFAILRPLQSKDMASVARELWEVMSIFGVSKIIQSDNGSKFVNELIQELTSLNGIDHRTISPYNPRRNGAVERVHGTVENMLMKEVDGAMYRWEEYVPFVQLAYNCKVAALTASTPFSLMFGRRINGFKSFGRTATASPMALQLWRTHQENVFQNIFPSVLERVKRVKKKDKKYFATNRRVIRKDEFPPVASGMMCDMTKKSKLVARFEGPFTVVRKNRGGAFVLRDELRKLKRAVLLDHLKLTVRDKEGPAVNDPTYEVEEVSDHRTENNGKMSYFVIWKKKDVDPSWEPV